MSAKVEKNTNSIHVHEADSSSRVVFTPADNDRFVLTCAAAVRAVKVGMNTEAAADEIGQLITYVTSSLKAHGDRIADCYVMPRRGELTFFVVPRAKTYDHELSEILSHIDLKIAEKFQLIPSGLQQIPPSNIAVFVSDLAGRIPIDDISKLSSREVAT